MVQLRLHQRQDADGQPLIWLSAALAAPVDLNAARAETLASLPLLGPERVAIWLAWRAGHGPCGDLADLLAVPGFGAATVAALRGRATCGPVTPVEPGPPGRPNVLSADVVDVNRASAAELAKLPGLTPGRAAAIVADREANGPFASCDDLARVAGIGPATIANLRTGEEAATCVAR